MNLANRGPFQCLSEVGSHCLDLFIIKGPWRQEDEVELPALIAKLREKAWDRIAREMGHYSDVQCKYCHKQMQRQTAWTQSLASAADLSEKVGASPAPPTGRRGWHTC
jgi:hypothetical protein